MRILMFHDIRDTDPKFFPRRYEMPSFLSKSTFYKGLQSLSGKTLTSNDFALSDQIKNNHLDFILTFDDGLKDHLEVANILQKKNIKAVFFIPTSICQSSQSFINSNLIQFILASAPEKNICADLTKFFLERGFLKSQLEKFKTSKWALNVWSDEMIFITRLLREFPDLEVRKEALVHLAERFIPLPLSELHHQFYLNWNEVGEIHKMGHYIGSHGAMSFDYLYQNENSVSQDLQKSFEALREFRGGNALSYPNGGHSDAIVNIVKKCGFKVAFTTEQKDFSINDDALRIPRLDASKLRIFL